MTGNIIRLAAFGALLLLGAASLDAAQFLLVTRDANGAWSLQEADELSINGKTKVRMATAGPGQSDSWDSKSIGRLAEEPIESLKVGDRVRTTTL